MFASFAGYWIVKSPALEDLSPPKLITATAGSAAWFVVDPVPAVERVELYIKAPLALEIVDEENSLYKLNIKKSLIINDIQGVKKGAYDILSKLSDIRNKYRTYDYKIAKKSAVYFEPVNIVGLDEGKLGEWLVIVF